MLNTCAYASVCASSIRFTPVPHERRYISGFTGSFILTLLHCWMHWTSPEINASRRTAYCSISCTILTVEESNGRFLIAANLGTGSARTYFVVDDGNTAVDAVAVITEKNVVMKFLHSNAKR